MLAQTPGGDTYTAEQFRTWLVETGFEEPAVADVPGTDIQAVTGRRPRD